MFLCSASLYLNIALTCLCGPSTIIPRGSLQIVVETKVTIGFNRPQIKMHLCTSTNYTKQSTLVIGA